MKMCLYGETLLKLAALSEVCCIGNQIPNLTDNAAPTGFIAVVVCLSLIIIASCIAIFFLLRDHSQSDAERARRRQLRRYQQASPEVLHGQSWSTKLGTVLGFGGKPKENVRTGRGGRPGWIQASGDDWEYDSDEERHPAGELTEISKSTAYFPPHDSPFRPPVDHQVPSPGHFDLYGGPGHQYSQARSASSHSHVPSIHSRLSQEDSAPTSPIRRTASPEHISEVEDDSPSNGAGRQFSTQSGSSMWTQGGGTKFIEGV